MTHLTSEKETTLERYVRGVCEYMGYYYPPPEDVRGLIQKLRTEGYTEYGAAQHVRKILDINTL